MEKLSGSPRGGEQASLSGAKMVSNADHTGRKSIVREYAEAIIVAMLLAFAIRVFVVQAFKIPSGSMIPTLL
ncbi:MAG: S26 family signal peptidase, partial [Nitrospira sp.]|nr:S26 family signal peptidase [Nitrospira sp.]